MLKLQSHLLDALATVDTMFDGENPFKKINGETYMRYDEIRLSRDKVEFRFKGVALIEYVGALGPNDAVHFNVFDGLVKTEMNNG